MHGCAEVLGGERANGGERSLCSSKFASDQPCLPPSSQYSSTTFPGSDMDDTQRQAKVRQTASDNLSVKEEPHITSALEAFEGVVEDRLLSGPASRPEFSPLLDPDRSTRSRKRKTLAWQEIPGWQRDNEYILTGYRRCVNDRQSRVSRRVSWERVIVSVLLRVFRLAEVPRGSATGHFASAATLPKREMHSVLYSTPCISCYGCAGGTVDLEATCLNRI